MKIAVGQMEVKQGDVAANLEVVLGAIKRSRYLAADLLVLPEAALTGIFLGRRPCKEILAEAEAAAEEIARVAGDLPVVFGNVAPTGKSGCYLAFAGKLIKMAAVCQGRDLAGALDLDGEGQKAVLTIGDKNIELKCFLGDWRQLPAEKTADLCLHLAARPLVLTEVEDYRRTQPTGDNIWLFCNCCGLQNSGKTIYQMGGGSSLRGNTGAVYEILPLMEQTGAVWNLPSIITPPPEGRLTDKKLPETCFILHESAAPAQNNYWQWDQPFDYESFVFQALVVSVRRFFASLGKNKAVIGLSGGIDSALTACVCREALGGENLLLINMPTQYNSNLTRNKAAELAEALGAHYWIVPIEKSLALTKEQFAAGGIIAPDGTDWALKIQGLVEENIMARDRTARVLAAAAAAWNALFICNGNKAENTVGYATFYGDLAGAIAPLADLWKHQVYAAARGAGKAIPTAKAALDGIAAIRPSAELSTAQAVEEGKGDPLFYDYHDYLLAAFTEKGLTPYSLLKAYSEGSLPETIACADGLIEKLFDDSKTFCADLERWWRCYKSIGVAKRLQAPPLLAFTKYPFGETAGEIQAKPFLSGKYYNLKKQLTEGN
ncbi:MAG: NAD(+) synthase [Clostridia bacterium]|nr:NAD(+) synthase [Clostridia bacterium]